MPSPSAAVTLGGTAQQSVAPSAAPLSAAPVADATTGDAAAETPTDDAASHAVDAGLDWQAYVPTDVADHLATMDRAARDSGCGVPWHLLAAIARVESDFGRNMATSSAGALGYGQFLPSSWDAFGNQGNVYDYRDALPAIATYLCEAGLAGDPRAALFAYNHADWYVDLVLDLAVRYDRMAPGAPTPDVLDVGPTTEAGMAMHYAAGRDIKLQTRSRILDEGKTTWIGVPWRGRAAADTISPAVLETASLGMARGAFGLTGDVAPPLSTGPSSGLGDLANRAWASGLLPLRGTPQAFRAAGTEAWALADVKALVQRGLPVVALVSAVALPGHPRTDASSGDQPVVLIGLSGDGFVYSDPSFSSSLGYGLMLSEADFVKAWDSASQPRQALGFTRRPAPVAAAGHLREPEFPPVAARVTATPTPIVPGVQMPPAPSGAGVPLGETIAPGAAEDVATPNGDADRLPPTTRDPVADATTASAGRSVTSGLSAGATAGGSATASVSADASVESAEGVTVEAAAGARGGPSRTAVWMLLASGAALVGAALLVFRLSRARPSG